MVFDLWFETDFENAETAPEAWDLMMSHHCHEVNLDKEDKLSKEELAEKKAEVRRRTHFVRHALPMAKQEGE